MLLLALTTAGCSFAFGMPRGASDQAHQTFRLWQIFFVTAIPVAGIVYVLVAVAIVRFRRRRSDEPDSLGSQRSRNLPLELVYTIVPVLIVVVLFLLSLRTEERVTDVAPDPSLIVNVQAYAWGWRFTYPDGVTVVSPPSGEFAAQPVFKLPLGETVRIVLTSNDTIHAFWVPAFLYKHDAIPGRTFDFDITPTQLGTFQGHCAEFCGLNHAYMNFKVNVVSPSAFKSWLRLEESAV